MYCLRLSKKDRPMVVPKARDVPREASRSASAEILARDPERAKPSVPVRAAQTVCKKCAELVR
jgi:hypothetical protein